MSVMLSEEADSSLVSQSREGDDEAFRELVLRYQGRVYGLALRYLRNQAEAEEAAQEAFVRFHRSMDSFDTSRPLGPWLLTLCANYCKSQLRRKKIVGFLPLLKPDDDESQAPPQWAADGVLPDQDAEGKESLERLHGQIMSLPVKLRMPLVLKFFQGLEDQEAAAVLGISLNSFRVNLHRGREKLKGAIAHG